MAEEDLAAKWNEKVEEQKEKEDLIKKAENGDSDAMNSVGIKYHQGSKAFKRDHKLALEWFEKSHKAGSVMGTAALGSILLFGCTGSSKNIPMGIMYSSLAAAQGSDVGAYALGMALANGKHGMSKDEEEAKVWLKRALGVGACEHSHLAPGCKERAINMIKILDITASK